MGFSREDMAELKVTGRHGISELVLINIVFEGLLVCEGSEPCTTRSELYKNLRICGAYTFAAEIIRYHPLIGVPVLSSFLTKISKRCPMRSIFHHHLFSGYSLVVKSTDWS